MLTKVVFMLTNKSCVLQDIWQSRLSFWDTIFMVIDHHERPVLLRTRNISHCRFYKTRVPLFRRPTDSSKNPPVMAQNWFFLNRAFSYSFH